MKIIYFTLLAVTLSSCATNIKSNFTETSTALNKTDGFAFLTEKHPVPDTAKKLGSSSFKDSGFTTDCSLNSHLKKARDIARTNGANIVKVTKTKTADLWSTCTRIQVDYYFYDGDLKQLKQHQLTLD